MSPYITLTKRDQVSLARYWRVSTILNEGIERQHPRSKYQGMKKEPNKEVKSPCIRGHYKTVYDVFRYFENSLRNK